MNRLRVLIVDDHPRWRERLAEILLRVGGETGGETAHVDAAETEIEARDKIASKPYDLAVVDLALPKKTDERGFELLREIRANPLQVRCAVIVVTGTATTERIHRALQDFWVKKVVLKDEFGFEVESERKLLDLAREAILDARIRGAAIKRTSRCYLTLSFDSNGWVEGELRSPAGVARDRVNPPAPFNGGNFVRRADNINRFLVQDSTYTGWRSEMRDIGGALYDTLASVPNLYDKWASARLLVTERTELWLQFRGPAAGLGIPFDLLWDREEYLCLRHVLSREVERTGFTRHIAPFSAFVDSLHAQRLPLRILLVAANTDGMIPAVEEEVRQLQEQISSELGRLGLRYEVTCHTSSEASYARIKEELRHGGYHIFHYAGHGRYEDDQPQESGLVLSEGGGARALTANDLGLLAGSGLQLVFLSCCLGAVNKSRPEADDFYGIFHALASADVPAVVGHRWVVPDRSALLFATTFYSQLWRTLCPGEATLEARREAATGKWGRGDHTWAAPVLMLRSP